MMNEESTQSIGETVDMAVKAAEVTVRQPFVRRLARFGFYAKGVLFIVIGSLGILLATGNPEGKIADAAGALAIIAQQRFGSVLLIMFVIGAVGHGVWNILRAVADVDDAGRNWLGIFKRSIAGGIGIFYLGLAATAFEIVWAARQTDMSSQAEETFVSILLAVPILGALLLFLIGLGVIGAGFHECYAGVSGKYRDSFRVWEINGPHLTLMNILAVLSFTARALILVIMGYFFVMAAVWRGSDGAIGLDAALLALAQSGYGRALLFATAVGLFSHGILALYEAKYRRLC
ncbi:MAG TPA: DUF1206 domain-containing protein [Pyrinomonadaceae bacterium]|nr:DUF1206 domain-containing protein [Pyrinomonadaceae bacterium]